MFGENDVTFYRSREHQELLASDRANDPVVKRLHWEMAQRYAFLASELEVQSNAASPPSAASRH